MTMPGPALRSNNQDSTPGPAGPGWAFLFAAWLIATASTLGALFLSEVMQIAPCVLCWYQRVFMFPLVLGLFFLSYYPFIKLYGDGSFGGIILLIILHLLMFLSLKSFHGACFTDPVSFSFNDY